ncbi:MAG: hypothetical protein ACR2P2_18060 [Nakamurella sp.]
MFSHLSAPVRRVTRADVPVPFAPDLERAVVPGRAAISDAVLKTARY